MPEILHFNSGELFFVGLRWPASAAPFITFKIESSALSEWISMNYILPSASPETRKNKSKKSTVKQAVEGAVGAEKTRGKSVQSPMHTHVQQHERSGTETTGRLCAFVPRPN